MQQATEITGVSRQTIMKALDRGEIEGATQVRPHAPWSFTMQGLRRWIGIPDDGTVIEDELEDVAS